VQAIRQPDTSMNTLQRDFRFGVRAVEVGQADAAFWRSEAERAQMQLAAVSIAVNGGMNGNDVLKPGAYAYTSTLAEVLMLRQAFDRLALTVGEEQIHLSDLVDAQCEGAAA